MNARSGTFPADRHPDHNQACQQLDISEPLDDWRPGHRDRPLSFRWKADYETLSRVLELPRCKSKRGERALASIVYDAALAARDNPGRRISYSRRKVFYQAADRYYGTDYGYETVVPAVDALVAAGLLVEHHKVRGSPKGTGIQSSFLPAPYLADILLPTVERRPCELIRLKDADGYLVGYRDTERTMRDRRMLEGVNRHIAQADIRLHGIDGMVVDESAGTVFFPGFLQWLEDGIADHTVYTRMKELYRVYNGAWTLGGRFYGGWWQQVRARDRKHLIIDGGETIELDHETLHPRLLYAAAGQRLDGDAYTLDGWDRKVCKRAFNILLNTSNYGQALGAIRPHVGGNRHAAAALIADMKRRHSSVANLFHSGAGLRLQNVDAEMAKSVLRDLTVRQDVTVLPIHDSFIVRKEHQGELTEAMDRAFAKASASVGVRRAVSKGWTRINPQMEGAMGGSLDGGGGSGPGLSAAPMVHHSLVDGTHIHRVPEPPTVPPPLPDNVGLYDRSEHVQAASRTTAIRPPAFLNPANWGKVASEELQRMADRPLKGPRPPVRKSKRRRPPLSGQAGGN